MIDSPPGPPRPDADGNYSSPALQALKSVWEAYCQDGAGPDEVVGVIAQVGNFAHTQLGILEQQVETGISRHDDEAFALIFEAFEILLEGCEYMALEFTPDQPDDVEEPEEGFFGHGYDLVQEATNQMMAGHALALRHIEAMARVSCPFCQHVNSRGEPKCGNCGRSLPPSANGGGGSGQALNLVERQGLEREQRGGEAELTRNFVMVAELLEAWKAGAASAEQLEQCLDQLEQNFSGHLAETDRQADQISRAPQSRQEALGEALARTRRGLEMSLQSVAKMRLAFEREDDRYLFFGLTDLEEASRVLVEAYWANKRAAGK